MTAGTHTAAPEPTVTDGLDPIDPVTAEVIRSAMETVCFEMATYVSRTATTPILNQSNERNATILDWHGRLGRAVGRHPAVHAVVARCRCGSRSSSSATSSHPGDVIVANDPYHGGGHLPDFNVFAPVFDADGTSSCSSPRSSATTATPAARMAGGYNVFAKDIWSEGTRYPLLKIIDAGKERRDVVLTMRANNRLAGFIGDLRSQVGAAQLGVAPARRDRSPSYGADDGRVPRSTGPIADDARAGSRAEIASWPDGTYEADVYVDSDPAGNQDIHVHVAVTVDGDHLIVDFAGSDERPHIQAWSTFGNTRGNTIAQLASLVDPTIPKNEGFFDCIELRVPRGHVREPGRGQAGLERARHHPGVEVGDAIAIALSQIIPDRCAPQTYKYGSPARCGAISTRARASRSSTTAARSTPAGSTRCKGVDGWGALTGVERQPHQGHRPRSTRRSSRTSSAAATTSPTPAAPGQWRGGCGSLLREGSAHPDLRQPVRRQPAPHPPRHRRRAQRARPTTCVVGDTEGRSPDGRRRAARDRRAARLRLRRRRRLGRSPRSRPAGRPRRRVGRVRVGRRRAPRLRRRDHRVARRHDPGARPAMRRSTRAEADVGRAA